MKILVTGAGGFIGAQIVTDLLAAGHEVVCCARNIAYTQHLFPTVKVIACDFKKDVQVADWLPRLEQIDVVINCVGILYHPNKKIIWATHYDAPKALFDACVQSHVKQVIQISALGVEQSEVEYAKSKKAADDYLLSLPLQAVILRPSLVYGRGSYGGTSLFRGLASLPWLMPIPGKGEQQFQPIHMEDLAKAIVKLIANPPEESQVLNAAGPELLNLKQVLRTLRSWLSFPKAKLFFIPLWLIKLGSRFGDLIPYSSLNSTSFKMMMQNNITSNVEVEKFHAAIGFVPRSFSQGVYTQPATVQDRWHARLFFVKPLVQLSLAFVWIWTALCSAFFYSAAKSYQLLAEFGISGVWQHLLLYSASLVDFLIGLAILVGFQAKKIGLLQIIVIVIYTVLISWRLPGFWLEPFAPIAKNIPILVLILIWLSLESDR